MRRRALHWATACLSIPTCILVLVMTAFGSAASATDWWLGPDPESPRRMPREQFVAHLTTIMMGVVVGTAEVLGITVDPDQPVHSVVPSNPAAS